MERELVEVAKCFANLTSSNPTVRDAATQQITSQDAAPGFGLLVLRLVSTKGAPMEAVHPAVIYFKNWVRKFWDLGETSISAADRTELKKRIVPAMLQAPTAVQRQLAAAVEIMARSDFPAQWPTLARELCEQFHTGNYPMIVGALQAANSIFSKYRHEFKSDELWSEIKIVLTQFGPNLMKLFQVTVDTYLDKCKSDPKALRVILAALEQIVNAFISLNSQTIPEEMEESMNEWMPRFQRLLTSIEGPDLEDPSDPDSGGPVEKLRALICSAIQLYAERYDEEFKDYNPKFVETVWKLLVGLPATPRYDVLATAGMAYLNSVVKRKWNRSLFADAQAHSAICTKIIIPNVRIREGDVEDFEDDPVEWVRRDMEGSDLETRRRLAVDLVKGLCTFYEKEVTPLIFGIIQSLLEEYKSNPGKNWAAKDAALNLAIGLSVRGETAERGVVAVNAHVPLDQLLVTHVLPELSSDSLEALPIVKADCIKFISMFRNFLPDAQLPRIVQLLSRFLTAKPVVLHSYAAIAIDKLLRVRDEQSRAFKLSAAQIGEFFAPLIVLLFDALAHEGSEHNEYVMAAAMRICARAGAPLMRQVVDQLLGKLVGILHRIAKEKKNPNFNHAVWETMAICVRDGCTSAESPEAATAAVDKFEKQLFPIFQEVLASDDLRVDWGPYVFQVMAQMLRYRGQLTPVFEQLFGNFMAPIMWKDSGVIQALTMLIQVYMEVGGPKLVALGHLERTLGVYQNLLASAEHDHRGVALLRTLVAHVPFESMKPFMPAILGMLLKRLKARQASNSWFFVAEFVSFFCQLVQRLSPQGAVALINGSQAGLFEVLLNKIVGPNARHAAGSVDRKLVCVTLTQMATSAEFLTAACTQQTLAQTWAVLVEAALGIAQKPDRVSAEDLLLADNREFSGAFSKLVAAGLEEVDPLPSVGNLLKFFVAEVNRFMAAPGGPPRAMLVAKLDAGARTALEGYSKQPPTTGGAAAAAAAPGSSG